MTTEPATLREKFLYLLQKHKPQQLKPSDIALLIKDEFPVYCAKKTQETAQTNFNLAEQIANQISARSKVWMTMHPQVKSSDETPRTYWWEDSEVEIDEGTAPQLVSVTDKEVLPDEKTLYPMLAMYLAGMKPQKLYPKRINEGKSSNTMGKNGNKYLHPDMVAMEDLMPSKPDGPWSDEVRRLAIKSGAPQTKIWSFEVKVNIRSVSEAREDYLQALTNSSWANYGYLVALQISANAFKELKVLHDLHGIGVIELSTKNPKDDTVVKLPARERQQVDWGTCNRIASQNGDFRDFLEHVADFHTNEKTHAVHWDIPEQIEVDD